MRYIVYSKSRYKKSFHGTDIRYEGIKNTYNSRQHAWDYTAHIQNINKKTNQI
jgi:hypothetical protein